MIKTSLARERERVGKAPEAVWLKIGDVGEFGMSWCRTCGDMEWLGADVVKGIDVVSQRPHKELNIDGDIKCLDAYLELFGYEAVIRGAGKFHGFSAKSRDDIGEVERLIVWVARVNT